MSKSKQQKTVDKVLQQVNESTQEEISTLLDKEVQLTELELVRTDKETFLEDRVQKTVISTMEVSGDRTGQAFIFNSVDDAIIMGGTLIMLPEDQIEETRQEKNFDGEAADAYGEVANIIAGAFTSIFLDVYSKNLHFKRTDFQAFSPAKLDPDEDELFPAVNYYLARSSIQLQGYDMGQMEVLIPLELLELEEEAQPQEEQAQQGTTAQGDKAADTTPSSAETPEQQETPEQAPAAEEATTSATSYNERQRVDRILGAALQQTVEEVGSMLNSEVTIADTQHQFITKEDYFEQPRSKSVATQLHFSGEQSGTGYLICDLKDAIFFGATLVMLPQEERNARIQEGALEGEEADAFGEVANIIAGAFSTIMEEQFPQKLHVKCGESASFVPTKVDVEAQEPFSPGEYYLTRCQLEISDYELETIEFLFPVSILGLKFEQESPDGWEDEAPQQAPTEENTKEAPGATATEPSQETAAGETPTTSAPTSDQGPALLIVADDTQQSELFQHAIEKMGHNTLSLGFMDNFKKAVQGYQILAAILIMSDVDEQGLAIAIKLEPCLEEGQPLIVAGPQWTRAKVIQAAKYGATDIIVTPADEQSLASRLQRHIQPAQAVGS